MLQGRGACLPRGVCFHPSGTTLFYTEMLTSRSGAQPVSYTPPQTGMSGLVHQDLTPGVALPQLAWSAGTTSSLRGAWPLPWAAGAAGSGGRVASGSAHGYTWRVQSPGPCRDSHLTPTQETRGICPDPEDSALRTSDWDWSAGWGCCPAKAVPSGSRHTCLCVWEAIPAKGEPSGSLMMLGHIDTASGAEHLVFLDVCIPKTSQHPSVVLSVEDDYFLKVFHTDHSIDQIIT